MALTIIRLPFEILIKMSMLKRTILTMTNKPCIHIGKRLEESKAVASFIRQKSRKMKSTEMQHFSLSLPLRVATERRIRAKELLPSNELASSLTRVTSKVLRTSVTDTGPGPRDWIPGLHGPDKKEDKSKGAFAPPPPLMTDSQP